MSLGDVDVIEALADGHGAVVAGVVGGVGRGVLAGHAEDGGRIGVVGGRAVPVAAFLHATVIRSHWKLKFKLTLIRFLKIASVTD